MLFLILKDTHVKCTKIFNVYRLPYGSPIGYFFTMIWQFIVALAVLLILSYLVPIALGAFSFALTFAKDFKGDLHAINEMANTKQHNGDILKRTNEFIRSYSNVSQLSSFSFPLDFRQKKLLKYKSKILLICFSRLIRNFEHIFEVCTFTVFSGCVISLSTLMFVIQVEIIVE